MRKQSARSLTLALSRAAADVLVGKLSSLNYGSTTTPGPRQTAILADIARRKATRRGRRAATAAEIAETQGIPVSNVERALSCLRCRGLVDRRGTRFGLTIRGAEAAALFSGVQVPDGIGLVLTGHTIRRV